VTEAISLSKLRKKIDRPVIRVPEKRAGPRGGRSGLLRLQRLPLQAQALISSSHEPRHPADKGLSSPDRPPLGPGSLLWYSNYGSIYLFSELLRLMASVTTRPPDDSDLARSHRNGSASSTRRSTTVRIEPPRGWLELRLAEVWQYRELLYFFVWRDVKVAISDRHRIAWSLCSANDHASSLFLRPVSPTPLDASPIPFSYSPRLSPGPTFHRAPELTSVVVTISASSPSLFPTPRPPIFRRRFWSVTSPSLPRPPRGHRHLRHQATLAALWLPVLLLLAVLTALGVASGCPPQRSLSDVRYVVPSLSFWMFASPVAYRPPCSRALGWLYGLIPWPASLTASDGLTGHGVAPAR